MDYLLSYPGNRTEVVGAWESGDVSLHYEMERENAKSDDRNFVINIIDSPGHVDARSEATCILPIVDGAIVVVDEGVSPHQEGLIRHAVNERIRPVLALNVLDSWVDKYVNDGEEVYQALVEAIKKANDVMEVYEDKLLGKIIFDPEKGSVAFTSMCYGWGFTLTSFTNIFAPAVNIDEARNKIWGEHFDLIHVREGLFFYATDPL